MSKLEILLSTYNGERFLELQMQSILDGNDRDCSLLVRDDGSSDSTAEILSRFAKNYPDRIKLLGDGGHLGLCGGFSRLMAASTAEHIMFCDQDDFWLPDKIEKNRRRMTRLEEEKGRNTPLLVHSDLVVADKDLSRVHGSFWSYQGILPENAGRFNRQLVMNAVTGCTMMINRPLLELATPVPGEALVHDWWIAQVASAFGSVAAIREPLVIYRQHGDNRIGAKGYSSLGFIKRMWRYSVDKVERGRQDTLAFGRIRQVRQFHERYATRLDAGRRSILEGYFRLCDAPPLIRFFIMARFGFWRPGLLRNIAMGMKARFSG